MTTGARQPDRQGPFTGRARLMMIGLGALAGGVSPFWFSFRGDPVDRGVYLAMA